MMFCYIKEKQWGGGLHSREGHGVGIWEVCTLQEPRPMGKARGLCGWEIRAKPPWPLPLFQGSYRTPLSLFGHKPPAL